MYRLTTILFILLSLNNQVYSEELTWSELAAISIKKLESMGQDTADTAQDAYDNLESIAKDLKDKTQDTWNELVEEFEANEPLDQLGNSI